MTGLWDTTQLRKLTEDLGKVSGAVVPEVIKVTAVSGEALVKMWQANAKATSGTHGKLYPGTISGTGKTSFGLIGFEAGPESGKPQGGMGKGFEYGSVNQSPHLDGNRAADVVGPTYAEALAQAVLGLISGVGGGGGKSSYTTRSGNTIMASDAQIAHWTRGAG